MSRLAKLIEQTTYLLAKQHEAQTQTEALFADVLSFIEKSAETKPEAHKDRLMEVYELLSKRAETISHYAQEDIDFLKDQLKALQAIQQVKDPKAAAEMLEALVDEDEEVVETPAFKVSLDEELEQSRQVLSAVFEDIKEALSRNDIKETEILIESMLEAEDMDDEDEDEEDDEDYEDEDDFDDEDEEEDESSMRRNKGKKKGGCGDCSGGCGPKGCGGCSASGDGDVEDFFSFMGKYDQDLSDDLDEDEDEEESGCCSDDEDEKDDECCTK